MFSWKEVYITYSQPEQIRIQKLLEEHHIPVKIKVQSNRGRIADDVILRGNPSALNSAGMRTDSMNEYRILTKKSSLDTAKRLLGL